MIKFATKKEEDSAHGLWLEDFENNGDALQRLMDKGSEHLTRLMDHYVNVSAPSIEEEKRRKKVFNEIQEKDRDAISVLHKQRKIEENKPLSDNGKEEEEEEFKLLNRISDYCENLSEEAQGKLKNLKNFAKEGNLKKWKKICPGRSDVLSLLFEVSRHIEYIFASFGKYFHMSGIPSMLNDEQHVGGCYDSYCAFIYPLLLRMETLYPGSYIEDLKYIWYMIADFYDFQVEGDAPKKEDFKGLGMFHCPAADLVMHYPPPLENLEISPTAVVEALLMDQPINIELVPYLSGCVTYDFENEESGDENEEEEEEEEKEILWQTARIRRITS